MKNICVQAGYQECEYFWLRANTLTSTAQQSFPHKYRAYNIRFLRLIKRSISL